MEMVKGRICKDGEGAGAKDFTRRMTKYPDAFERATGEHLVKGTLNVDVGRKVRIKEHFRVHGNELNEPEDFQFEVCRINGIWAYRVRPIDVSGGGGHADNIIEIVCSQKIPNATPGTEVEIVFFPRDSWNY